MNDTHRSPNEADNHRSGTVAPTSEATLNNLNEQIKNEYLTPDENDFVTLMVQYYGIKGRVMDLETAVDVYNFTESEFTTLWESTLVKEALKAQGLTQKQLPEKVDKTLPLEVSWKAEALEPLQLIAANMMLDLVDTRSQKKKLQDLGVSTSTWNMWLKDEVFSSYLKARAEAMLGENQHEAHLALLDSVRAGNIQAIAYYNEMTGRHVKQTAGGNAQTDFKVLLVKILEVIADEVDDPEVARNIADRLQQIASAQVMANQLMGETGEIEQPTVRKARELSPRLKELMEG